MSNAFQQAIVVVVVVICLVVGRLRDFGNFAPYRLRAFERFFDTSLTFRIGPFA